MTLSRTVVFTILTIFADALVEFDNSISDKPEITCANGELHLKVATLRDQPSHVFAKGHFRKEGCSFTNTTNAVFDFSKCDVSRQREVNPKGMAYTMTVVVQLHPLFTTKVDRAYKVRCFYKESEKVVGAEVAVSDPTPTQFLQDSVQPSCVYTIHKGSPNGPLAKYAQLGDTLFHVWDCPSDAYEMFVHDCYVVDGEGSNNRKVISENGCSNDVFIMPQIIYNENRTKAFVNSNAFNFPDQNSVKFNCQIQICPSLTGECYKPKCDGTVSEGREQDTLRSDLAEDELITTSPSDKKTQKDHPSAQTFTPSTTTSTTTTTAPTTTTEEPSTVTFITTTSTLPTTTVLSFNDATTITLPQEFPTPVFTLLKGHKNKTRAERIKDADLEGSGHQFAHADLEVNDRTTTQPSDDETSTKRELKRRDAVDVDISSPEVMIIDRDFASELPEPQELSKESVSLSGSESHPICIPFFVVWILGGIALFSISITFTAICYSLKQKPSFNILP